MKHATTAAQTDIFRAAPLALMAFDECAAHGDEDWKEFLSLGLPANTAELGTDARGWRRTPVLLSY